MSHEASVGCGGLAVIVSSRAGVSTFAVPPNATVVIGRAASCDIVIPDDSVSRRHAALHFKPALGIEDLGSHNGTRVGGVAVEVGQRLALSVGAAVELGAATLLLRPISSETTERAAVHDPDLVLADPSMLRLYSLLDMIAPSNLSILVLGETGTGKEVLARAIHDRSDRRTAAFVPVNCAAIPESLIESVLFGHEQGAFTGATSARIGLFEAADGGTLFLDEVGDLAAATQAKLLRALESGEILPVGSPRQRRVSARIVAATNRDLLRATDEGHFRPDLFYRLNGFCLTLPPLRKRPLDVLPLARHLLARGATPGRATLRLSEAAERRLLEHAWPGNVRELDHVLQRARVLSAGASEIGLEHLSFSGDVQALPGPTATAERPTSPPRADPADERSRIERTLENTAGNQTEAARLLGVSRRGLIKKIERLGIPRPRKGGKELG